MADKKKNKSFSMKIFSVVVAVVIWLILIYTVDPEIKQTVKNVPISFSGEEQLAAKGLVLINTSDIEKVDIKVRGQRASVIKSLETIRATVDVSDITVTGKSSRYASFDMGVGDVYIEGRNNALITVEVDELVDKNVPIRVLQTGVDKNKATITETKPEFTSFTVRGAKSELELLKEIVVEVGAEEFEKNGENRYGYYFVNYNGEKESFESLKNVPQTIAVTSTVYKKQTVAVKAELSKNSDSFELKIKEGLPKQIDIGVPDGYNGEITEISYKFNPDNYKENEQYSVLLLDVPEGVYVSEDTKTIGAELELIPIEKADVRLNVEVRNAKDGFDVKLSPDKVTLLVTEPKDSNLKDKLTAYVDIAGLGEGTHECEVKTDGIDGLSVKEVAHVRVTITKG